MAHLRNARKLLNKAEIKSFEPVFSRKLSSLNETQLKKKVSLARKYLTDSKVKSKKQKPIIGGVKRLSATNTDKTEQKIVVFKEILDRLQSELSKVQRNLPKKAKEFDKAKPDLADVVSNTNRQHKRLAVSERIGDGIATSKHWEKTPLRRMEGFQSGRSRRRQGVKDHRGPTLK